MTVTVQWLPRLEQPQPLKIGGLFYGYGGLDIAVQQVIPNTELAWYAEFDKGASKIGAHHHPGVPNHGDVTQINWEAVEPVDILTGGSPCQDLSHAGKRAGMTEGTRSNLWVAMREAIAHLRPSLVVWENVRGAYSAPASSSLEHCPGCMGDPEHRGPVLRALGRVLGDLADLGYDARWVGLRAADVGAPHGRHRVFLVASPADSGCFAGEVPTAGRLAGVEEPARYGDPRGARLTLLPTPAAHEPGGTAEQYHQRLREHDGRESTFLPLGMAVQLLPTPRATDGTKGGPNQAGSSGDLMLPSAVQPHRLLPTPSVADVQGGRKGRSGDRSDELLLNGIAAQQRWGDYAPAIARWETVLNRPAPDATQLSSKGNPQLSPRFVEWMMGLPPGHVTDVPGITRNEALKALGNGVVTQQAAAALRVLLAP